VRRNPKVNPKYIAMMKNICKILGNFSANITPDQQIKQCCGSFESPKLITLKMIEDDLVPLCTEQTMLQVKAVDSDIMFMYVWHQLDLNDILRAYERYFMTPTMSDIVGRFKTMKITDLVEEITMIGKIPKRYHDLIENINRLKDLIKLSEGTNIEQLKKRVDSLQSDISQLDIKHKQLLKEIEADLTKTIEIFEQSIREMVDINKFYQNFDITSAIYSNELNQFFDVKTKNMSGGDLGSNIVSTKYSLNNFIELLNADISKSIAAHDKLMLYCQKSAILKSRYTLLYNKLRQYNKSVIDIVLFNLYKLTTFRDIISEKMVINRFIKIDELKEMKILVDGLILNDDKRKNKYAVVIGIASKLFDSFFEKVKNLHDSDCIDIGLTNYIIDFILIINFCKKLSQK
jgi:hypothetical protein